MKRGSAKSSGEMCGLVQSLYEEGKISWADYIQHFALLRMLDYGENAETALDKVLAKFNQEETA